MISKPKLNKIQDSLLAAIQRKIPSQGDLPPETPVEPGAPAEPTPAHKAGVTVSETMPAKQAATKGRVGKPVQFWLHEEDQKLIRELAAWLSSQGLRASDSAVIRSALRTAKTGGEFLEAFRKTAQLDGRLKLHKR